MNAEREIERLLKTHAVDSRVGSHRVWKLDNGTIFVQSLSPSDVNAVRQQLRDLQNLLGIQRVMVKRRPDKIRKPGPPPTKHRFDAPTLPDWKDQLRGIKL